MIYNVGNGEPKHKILTATLTSGSTTLSFTDNAIDSDSLISVYTNVFGVNPTALVQSNHTVTLTFDAQESNITVKLEVA